MPRVKLAAFVNSNYKRESEREKKVKDTHT